MAIDLNGIVTWLEGWFYKKEDVNTYLNAKANLNQGTANYNVVTDGSGNIDVEPKINVASGSGLSLDNSTKALSHSNTINAQSTTVFKKFKYDGQGHITGTADVGESDLPSHTHDGDDVEYTSGTSVNDAIDDIYTNALPSKAPYAHNQATTTITNSETYSNLGSNLTNQKLINDAINTKIGTLSSIEIIKVVDTKPTPSADTMNKLYIVSENSKVNVYYTKQTGTGSSATYTLVKMDTDILDELSIAWTDVTGKPSFGIGHNDFSRGDHWHGQITWDGSISSTAVTVASDDNIVITDTSDSSKVKRVANLLANQIVDSNGHFHIGSFVNDTQATINTKIDNKFDEYHQSLAERKVFYLDYDDIATCGHDYGYDGLFLTTHNGEWLLYFYREITSPYLDYVLDYVTLSVSGHTHNNYVTSIALVPKSSDNTGAIRLYYGDEPSNS